jgi:hypothetical protein
LISLESSSGHSPFIIKTNNLLKQLCEDEGEEEGAEEGAEEEEEEEEEKEEEENEEEEEEDEEKEEEEKEEEESSSRVEGGGANSEGFFLEPSTKAGPHHGGRVGGDQRTK